MTASWLSAFLAASLSPSTLQHTVQEAQRREDGAWEAGRGEERRGSRRKCVWIRGVCSVTVYNPLRCRLCRKGNHFSCWETFPHVNLTPPPTHVYFPSLICSPRSFSLSSLSHWRCHFFFYPFITLLPRNGIPPLYSRRWACENWTLLRLLSLKLSLLAIILCAARCVVL